MQIKILLLPAAALAALVPASAQSQQSPVSPQPEQKKTWTKKQIRKTVREILSEVSGIPEEKIEPHHSFDKDLGMDSLDAVEAILSAEEAFGIAIPDEVVEKLKQVEMMEEYLIERLEAR